MHSIISRRASCWDYECFVSAIGLSAWKDAVTFAILIIVLLVKPTGFLGRKVQEKV